MVRAYEVNLDNGLPGRSNVKRRDLTRRSASPVPISPFVPAAKKFTRFRFSSQGNRPFVTVSNETKFVINGKMSLGSFFTFVRAISLAGSPLVSLYVARLTKPIGEILHTHYPTNKKKGGPMVEHVPTSSFDVLYFSSQACPGNAGVYPS